MPRRTARTEPGAPRSTGGRATTLSGWRREARATLAAAGIPSAAAEADLLLTHALALRRVDLTLERERPLTRGERARLDRLLAARLRRVPVQYVIGEVDFMGIRLTVGPDVLVPRPETEGLVDRVIARVPPGPATVIDVGTGSGAIALALAAARPAWRLWGIDVSPAALRRARRNARQLKLSGRVRFLAGDLLRAVDGKRCAPPLRAVVANLPYVARSDRSRLAPEVKDHEPAIALFAGDGGMEMIARLVPQAARALSAGGLLALEIGEDLGARVREALARSGKWTQIAIERDLAGKDRYALAVRGVRETRDG